jgi:thiol-disulfide isomerase/thioredoxin
MPWFRCANTSFAATLAAAWLHLLGSLTVSSAAPINDNFVNAIPLSGMTSVIGSNVGATVEPQEPAHAEEPANHSVWWRWTALSTGTFSLSTSNSSFDTVLAVYTGNAFSNLVPVLSNDDFDFGILWSRVFFRAYAGETFYIAVDGSGGSTGAVQLNIAPITTSMGPWNADAAQGGQPLFSTNYAGKVLLIDFWETICGTCVDELPYLIGLHTGLQDQGFAMIGLATDHDPMLVTAFLAEWTVPYPMGLANPTAESALAGSVGTLANPTKFLVDREGKVVARYPGANSISLYANASRALLRPSPFVRLEIARAGADVTLSWPATASGYQRKAPRSPASLWTPTTDSIQIMNGKNVAQSGGRRHTIFRLKT